MDLSPRFKEAFKTALAMVLAYGIALSMDWEKPVWASYGVALISLGTVGASLQKGILRVAGTLIAAAFSIALVAVFPQERWWFMALLALYMGLCTWLMVGSKRPYLWNVAGFVAAIICLGVVPATDHAFDVAILRTLETGLGVLCYSLVTLLLWPVSAAGALDDAARELAATQHRLFRGYLDLVQGRAGDTDLHPLRMQEVRQVQQLGDAFAAAREDTYEVREMRREWARYADRTHQIMETLERWREGFDEVRELDIEALIPGYRALADELDARFGQIERLLAGKGGDRRPVLPEPALDGARTQALTHFERAALALFLTQLRRLEALTRQMLETLLEIKGSASLGPVTAREHSRPMPRPGPIPDPERIGAAVQVMATLWIAYLAWLYLELPGGIGPVILSGSLGMAFATSPQLPMRPVFKPLALASVFASIVYIFMMPRLDGFLGLGTLIFVITFAVGYLFHRPQQALGRIAGILLFTTMANISNEQTYSFLSLVNTFLMFPIGLGFIAIGRHIPFSSQPQRAYLRLVRRFFRSCRYLSATLLREIGSKPTWIERWRDAYHLREIDTLPGKIGQWVRFIPPETLGDTKPDQLQGLTTRIQALGYRMREIVEARAALSALPPVEIADARHLQQEIDAWRAALEQVFAGLALDPGAWGNTDFRTGLDAKLQTLEAEIERTLNHPGATALSPPQAMAAYRLLGAHRGLSEAVIHFTKGADAVDWPRLTEERF